MEHLAILGATGTIGDNTLDVIRRHPNRFSVYAVAGQRNAAKMLAICREFEPTLAVMVDESAAEQLAVELRSTGCRTEVHQGAQAVIDLAHAEQVDTVVAAIVGAAGLLSTLAAAKAGKKILLANKEALVMSGAVFMEAVEKHQAILLPLDSEHNALFQCLPKQTNGDLDHTGVARLHLTASGGPFLQTPIDELKHMRPEQACAHPNWVMGRKISVDSATMMNKGLEVIEASWLFRADASRIRVVIHPQSIIHSLVEYADGSFLAQLGQPDMRVPITHALAWPHRMHSGVKQLELTDLMDLQLEKIDYARFPCLALAEQALRMGGTSSTVLNAANEIAVAAFLDGDMAFTDIAACIEKTMETVVNKPADDLSAVLAQDALARAVSREIIDKGVTKVKNRYG